MSAPRPLRIVKTSLVVYVAALFLTAPFTGSAEPAPVATAPVAPLAAAAPGAGLVTVAFAVPVTGADLAAGAPEGARVTAVSAMGPGGAAGYRVPDGMPLATLLAVLGPEVAGLPVTSVEVAAADAPALRAAFPGRVA